jgi:hypothetical protein
MEFEARPLRVQLPCKGVTVIDAEEYDVRVQAHRYWRLVAQELGGIDVAAGGKCEECSGNPSEPLCENASEKLNLYAIIDHRVLPILRKQLEARLREIKEAEDAVARGGR